MIPPRALVIGAGPAGLMTAEVLGRAGLPVILADAMPSPGRKFLMAGKSGLNLTKDEGPGPFMAAYRGLSPDWAAAIADFGPDAVTAWARGLGQPVFTGTSGRVFPVAMKASPLLRAWLDRLDSLGVVLRRRWRWTGWDGPAVRSGARFDTPDGPARIATDVAILALGGASWRRLGSDGAWAGLLPGLTAPFSPVNVGLRVNWSGHMARHFGQPVKGCALIAGACVERGEFIVSQRGLEGGGIYAIGPALRDGATLTLDLAPDLDLAAVRARLARASPRDSLPNRLRKALRLPPVQIALLQEWGRPLPGTPGDPGALAALIKALPVRHAGPRPLDEAISTAGGLRADALDGFMLRDRPGTFAAGEMLDWEAGTGGYLITGCLATGRAAARQALDWLGHGA